MSTFHKLRSVCPGLCAEAEEAEEVLTTAPAVAIESVRLFGDLLSRAILAFEGLQETPGASETIRLNTLSMRGFLPPMVLPFFHSLGGAGAEDNGTPSVLEMRARLSLRLATLLAAWFAESYGPHLPPTLGKASDGDAAVKIIGESPLTEATRKSARRSAARRSTTFKLSEDETRVIIDFQLRTAGWRVDTLALRYSRGARPEKGVSKAIAEWPTTSGPADYALFAGLDFIGVIEAKKMGKDIVSDLMQSKRYARDATLEGQARFMGGPWENYRVPFLFSTNGRPYLEQLKEKSGIWLLDARSSTNHPRPLQGWYSAEDLAALFKQDVATAHARLAGEPMDYLGLRDYQEKAIREVEAALDEGRDRLLIAMATGTGKTRLAIGLMYRLLKTERFRRILFVVDRNALGEQAGDKFKETRLEELKTFDQIYDLKEVDAKDIESTTRVNIATVQGLMRNILYPSDALQVPGVGRYDCIIVDEAHRGYTLDRELSEDELLYRSQDEYLSKYRRVIEYFDAVKIGLTATPAPHTVKIFGPPVYNYSYREAVVDGWLVDHEPPHQIVTRLSKEGIQWAKGDTVPVFDPATGQITNIEEIPDEIRLEIDHFNKLVLTRNFNLTVARELAKHLDLDGEDKTLVFAATDDHADTVVTVLKEAFEEIGVPVTDDAIVKITGSIDRPESMIRRFKNERLPNIVVTVDLLTTGIDVPEIRNLVFLRRVRSRILFEQMLGRATRLCDRIKKDHFEIYDAVAIYEALEPVNSMKAVAADPTVTLGELADELDEMLQSGADHALLKKQMDQILAKLQRILRWLDEEALGEWKTLSGGQSLEDFIGSLRGADLITGCQAVADNRRVVGFLDENRSRRQQQLISHHEDELLSHDRGYGNARKPEDYLNAFREFIILNINKIPALAVVCQRPRDLTRQTLKELKLALDQAGFTEKNLQVAWKDWKNEDIAADIISFVRRQALGEPLISHEERIRGAMARIHKMKEWTAIQRQWLERIEKQLIAQTLMDREDFDRGAFKNHGGFKRLDKIFQGNFQQVLDDLNTNLYLDRKATA